jgi:hypothetical protein
MRELASHMFCGVAPCSVASRDDEAVLAKELEHDGNKPEVVAARVGNVGRDDVPGRLLGGEPR